jgi:hypothetical protein
VCLFAGDSLATYLGRSETGDPDGEPIGNIDACTPYARGFEKGLADVGVPLGWEGERWEAGLPWRAA